MNENHFVSRMLICAGALMTISGVLLAINRSLIAAILLAGATCMFAAARNFHIAEEEAIRQKEEQNRKEKETQS